VGRHAGLEGAPYLNRNEVENYTAAEVQVGRGAPELDGPLVDFERKERRSRSRARRLSKTGTLQAQLTLKAASRSPVDRSEELPRGKDRRRAASHGRRMRKVAVFYRDFKPVGGLRSRTRWETVVESVKGSHKMTIQAIKVKSAAGRQPVAKAAAGLGQPSCCAGSAPPSCAPHRSMRRAA